MLGTWLADAGQCSAHGQALAENARHLANRGLGFLGTWLADVGQCPLLVGLSHGLVDLAMAWHCPVRGQALEGHCPALG